MGTREGQYCLFLENIILIIPSHGFPTPFYSQILKGQSHVEVRINSNLLVTKQCSSQDGKLLSVYFDWQVGLLLFTESEKVRDWGVTRHKPEVSPRGSLDRNWGELLE